MDTPKPLAPENDIETGLEHLQKIETELEEIKERTADPKRSLFNGILSGAGAIIGSITALIILGWLLSLIGILPGFGSFAAYLHGIVDRFNTRY
ncbi:MAG TPA: hypothetical protein VN665_00615 [Candidatus Paceibacterota bacterium]|nr:hypothetical protein [Candidatus Paceibacterota bacterium]